MIGEILSIENVSCYDIENRTRCYNDTLSCAKPSFLVMPSPFFFLSINQLHSHTCRPEKLTSHTLCGMFVRHVISLPFTVRLCDLHYTFLNFTFNLVIVFLFCV
jgi:hypothetical protein